jgi:DNA-binding transcriptional ArsR family regulator
MDDVAHAIADPVRREILLMLRGATLTVGEIARCFTISRPAVSRHLRVLRECGLVRDELVGRRRMYRLDAAQCDSRLTSEPLEPTRKSRSAPVSACRTWST